MTRNQNHRRRAIAAAVVALAASIQLSSAVAGDTTRVAGADIVVGSGSGSVGGHVKVFDSTNLGLLQSFFSFEGVTGGVDVATGDINGDGFDDIIAGAGSGTPGGHVKVFSGRDGSLLRSFFAFEGFMGGVRVAAGDVNSDGFDDIIVGAGPGAPGGHIKVFRGMDGSLLQSFFSFLGFTGGVDVAAGDINGDGSADIIVGAGLGAPGGHVKVFRGMDGSLLQSFFAFEGFTGGVRVATGDVNSDGSADIIVGAGPGAPGGHVKVFRGMDGSLLQSFFSFLGFTGGVDVAAGDINRDGFADIIVGAGPGAPGGHVKVFSGGDLHLLRSFFSFDGFSGGVSVAVLSRPKEPGEPDSDNDGIPDGADPDTVAAVVVELPDGVFAARGHRRAILARLQSIQGLILTGEVMEAIAELDALLRRIDGCPATPSEPESPGRNDWIVDCDAQRAVRGAIAGVISALRGEQAVGGFE